MDEDVNEARILGHFGGRTLDFGAAVAGRVHGARFDVKGVDPFSGKGQAFEQGAAHFANADKADDLCHEPLPPLIFVVSYLVTGLFKG
jgi:hypothetical protein